MNRSRCRPRIQRTRPSAFHHGPHRVLDWKPCGPRRRPDGLEPEPHALRPRRAGPRPVVTRGATPQVTPSQRSYLAPGCGRRAPFARSARRPPSPSQSPALTASMDQIARLQVRPSRARGDPGTKHVLHDLHFEIAEPIEGRSEYRLYAGVHQEVRKGQRAKL